MRFTPLSLGVATAHRASAAVLCTVLVAACDTDRPLSPSTPPKVEVPTAASAMVRPSNVGNLIITSVDIWKNPIGPTMFKITGPTAFVSNVTDNDPIDADKSVGKIWLQNLAVGSYNICEVASPVGYAIPDWSCHQSPVKSGTTTGVEPFVHNRRPYVDAAYTDILGTPIGGGTMTVKDSTGTPVMLILDNSVLDMKKTNGYFQFYLPTAGKFFICGVNPPAGYAVPPGLNPCLTVNAQWNAGHHVESLKMYPSESAAWRVQDPFGALVGPSLFSVSIPGVFLFNVEDNSTNDLDPTVGRLLAKFPSPGAYTLCQTVAPPNRYVANPACRTVNIVAGASVYAGWFTNNEKQVPSQ